MAELYAAQDEPMKKKSKWLLILNICPYTHLWRVIKKAVKECKLPAAARQGSYIFLLGLLCPFFWIALFRGASPEELRFHATHSGIVALIGLVIMIRGLIKEKPSDKECKNCNG